MNAELRDSGCDGWDAISHRLPLTEPASRDADTISEDLIRVVVFAFYDAVRSDEVVGPIFAKRITDWPRHLARMCDFWSTIVLRSGRYAGRPLDEHDQIPNLCIEHYKQWLQLWNVTIEQHAPPHVRQRFTVPAARMARTMAHRGDHHARVQRSTLL